MMNKKSVAVVGTQLLHRRSDQSSEEDVEVESFESVVLEAQKEGLATKTIGANKEEVHAELNRLMWNPKVPAPDNRRKFHRSKSQF